MNKLLIARVLAGLGVAALLAYVFLRDERPKPQAVRVAATASSAGAPAATGEEVKRSVTTRPLHLPDPAHVDILDAYPAARAAALEVQPGVELFGISGTGLVHGTLDLATAPAADAGPGGSLLFQFESAGGARGRDKVRRHVDVKVDRDGLHVTSIEGAALDRVPRGRDLETLDEPGCPSRRAWAAAVESGVPDDAQATFLLRGGPLVLIWSVHVTGHREAHREIDARTCSVLAPR